MKVIKAIIGLGNPGPTYTRNRHNIGFIVADVLVNQCGGSWQQKENMMLAKVSLSGSYGMQTVLVIKPQTYVNNSGRVLSYLQKQGIRIENIIVIHDELEKPFGSVTFKDGGSHKGHNGLKSIISIGGLDFLRLRFGIGRPADKEQVPNYVLENFKESPAELDKLTQNAVDMIIAKVSELAK